MQKWNFKTHTYEPYKIPKNWYCPGLCFDMDKIVNCANCGIGVKFGETYTSKTIHSEFGLGYYICEICYLIEKQTEKHYFLNS